MSNVINLCYDSNRKYIAETPEKNVFSQHSNILAACTGCIGGDLAKDVLQRLIHDKSLIKISMQFKAYYHIALVKNNIQQNYIDQLDDWKQLLREMVLPHFQNIRISQVEVIAMPGRLFRPTSCLLWFVVFNRLMPE